MCACKEKRKIAIGDEVEGGYVYYIDDSQYKIVKKVSFGEMTFDEASQRAQKLVDGVLWSMPSQDELRLIYHNIYLKRIGAIPGREYWTNDWYDYGNHVYTIDFWSGAFKENKNIHTSKAYFLGVAWRYLPKD